MRTAALSVAIAIALPLFAPKPGRRPPATPPALPPSPPPAALSIARVGVTFRATTALVTTDVTFAPPQGAREVFVAYGSPGLPTAFSAELLTVPEGRFSPAPDARGALQSSEHAVRAPSQAWLSIGAAKSAGRVVHLDARSLAAMGNPTLMALRLAQVHALTDRDDHPRSIVARISQDGAPLPLGEVDVRAEGASLERASAALCAPSGDDVALALTATSPVDALQPPLRARRRERQELCVRATLK